jgi:hypothetical protein
VAKNGALLILAVVGSSTLWPSGGVHLAAIGFTAVVRLLVGDHFAQVGDVFLDAGDCFGPAGDAFIRDSGGVLAFRFSEDFEGVLQLLVQGGAGHEERLSLESGQRRKDSA